MRNRLTEKSFRKANPDLPWLTQNAIFYLEDLLKKEDVFLEFGSGRSTAWFAERVKKIYSIENNKEWFEKVQGDLRKANLTNIDYRLQNYIEGEDPGQSEYTRIFKDLSPETISVALVDGYHRGYCALHSIPLIKKGGILIVDNVNWYLPHVTDSPSSKLKIEDCEPVWKEVHSTIKNWRSIWTTNGVTDTALFFKPC